MGCIRCVACLFAGVLTVVVDCGFRLLCCCVGFLILRELGDFMLSDLLFIGCLFYN